MSEGGPPEKTVPAALHNQVATRPRATFLECGPTTLSYEAFDARSDALAAALADRGVGHGDHVCLYLYNSSTYLLLSMALAKLGAVMVPIDTRFTGESLATVFDQVDSRAVFVDDRTRDSYEALDRSPGAMEFFVGEDPPTGRYEPFDALQTPSTTTPPTASVTPTDPLSVTFVQPTPGASPKGVVLPQYAYVNTGWEASEHLFAFGPEDRILTSLPLYSVFTYQIGVMGALTAGGTVVLLEEFIPEDFWPATIDAEASVFLYLSRMLAVLDTPSRRERYATNPVEVAIGHSLGFGADETLIKDFEAHFGVTVLEGYGTTQVATIATYNRIEDRRIGTVGRPVSHAAIDIVDEDGWSLPRGETGEIVVRPTRNNTMMQGYHGDPDATVADWQDQWIHTGDSGYIDEDGYLVFVASEENSIYRGRVASRISALEIEEVINTHPAVDTSVVVGVSTDAGPEEIAAVVIPTADLTPIDVYQHCKERLPYVKTPRYIAIRETLPRTPTGKVRHRTLANIDTDELWDRSDGYEFSR